MISIVGLNEDYALGLEKRVNLPELSLVERDLQNEEMVNRTFSQFVHAAYHAEMGDGLKVINGQGGWVNMYCVYLLMEKPDLFDGNFLMAILQIYNKGYINIAIEQEELYFRFTNKVFELVDQVKNVGEKDEFSYN